MRPSPRGHLNFNLVCAVLTFCFGVALFLLEPLGFVLSSCLMVATLCVFLGARNVGVIFLVAAGVPVALYYLFTNLLGVSLPAFPEL